MYAQGISTMYEESLKGLLPIMPGVQIPDTLSHESVRVLMKRMVEDI